MIKMATKEFTWAGELSKDAKEIKWNPLVDEDEDNDEEMLITHCLFLKQAVLGEDAKGGERNIVEVETNDWHNKKICQPVLSLKLDLNECCALDLTLLPPVTLRLKSGSGPVYLAGTHAMEMIDDEDYYMDSSLEDMSFNRNASPHLRSSSKKRRASAVQMDAAKKQRKIENGGTDEDEEDESNEDEDDEEDEDEDEGDATNGVDEVDEDDEDEEEDESMDDDEENEEEDSSPEKTKKKTKKETVKNGSAKKEPTKKGKGKGKKNSLDEIKKELSQSTIKPKKEDKFSNMVRSKYNLTDGKKIQDLWTWYKGTQLSK